MVVTRRSRSNNNSPASNNQENDNISATAAVRGNSGGGGSTPRGAPPPPPPPPPINIGAPLHQPPLMHEQQQPQQQGGMAPVPEEVQLLANNNNNGNGNNVQQMANDDGNNNNLQMAPQPNNIQYLQVRIYTNQLEPSRIHRRHHPNRQQLPVNPNMQHQKRFGRSKPRPTQQQQYHEGEIVKVLIPTQGFDSEKQLADCLNQASGSSSNSIDNNRGWQSSFDNDLEWCYKKNEPLAKNL